MFDRAQRIDFIPARINLRLFNAPNAARQWVAVLTHVARADADVCGADDRGGAPGLDWMSSIFVFPLEFIIWGGGVIVVRALVRRQRLGWANLLLLAVAFSLSEELLIHQTSLAPVIIKLKGVEYARAFGVNYVYLTWALLYEVIFVVFIPVALVELVFYDRREESWLNAAGGRSSACFLCRPVSWRGFCGRTLCARKCCTWIVYCADDILIVSAAVIGFCLVGDWSSGARLAEKSQSLRPPWPPAMFVLSGLSSVVIYFLILLGFGIWPEFPPPAAVVIGVAVAAVIVGLLPRFCAHEKWGVWHTIAVLYGAMLTMMGVFFFGFQGSTPIDFYGKVVVDLIAVVWMVWFAFA